MSKNNGYWRTLARRRGWYCAGYFVICALALGALFAVLMIGGPK